MDYCETHEDEAFAVNADGPKLIAEISAEKGAHVTYISTDFVFDGLSTRAYSEEMVASSLSVYGASRVRWPRIGRSILRTEGWGELSVVGGRWERREEKLKVES